MNGISENTVSFLKDLSLNNEREWFHANKPRYELAKKDFAEVVSTIIDRIRKYNDLGPLEAKQCMYRIQRDIRFSPDKTPYNTHFSAVISPEGKKTTHTPFFFRIKPDKPSLCLIGGGIWYADGKQLSEIRQEIDYNASELESILNETSFKKYFTSLEGEKLKRPPKGYDKDHPQIEWLKMKQFMVWHPLSKDLYTSEGFVDYVINVYRSILPFLKFWDGVLVHSKV